MNKEAMKDPTIINIPSKDSLTHLGSLDSFDITAGGKKAGKLLLQYFKSNDKKKLAKAIEIYDEIIPNENFGGEYTALEWLCKFLLAPEDAKEDLLAQPMVKSFYSVLAENNFEKLIEYLNLKYHFVEIEKGDRDTRERLRFLEDFILFNNPDRERWEKTRMNMEKLNLEKGMDIIDLGAGPGYYTFKFADIVGEEGKVYAIETNDKHLDFLKQHIKENNITNVEVVKGEFEGIGLDDEAVKVDMVYLCSLYHNIYAAFTEYERGKFVGAIRNVLREKGKLVIVDNDLVYDETIPYHGPYISKDLLVAHLHYHGFKLIDNYQFTKQRYVLVFEKTDVPEIIEDAEPIELPPNMIKINSETPVIRYRIIGTSTSGYTYGGKRAGQVMYDAFEKNDVALFKKAHEMFDELWPTERIGDDYTALMWFCEYMMLQEDEREAFLDNDMKKDYFSYFGDNNFDRLKQYLYYKFDLAKPIPEDYSDKSFLEYSGGDFSIATLNEWNEYLIFNNPNRKVWEKTDKMIDFIGIKEGDHVADIGCGGGYFSYEFSRLVGDSGKVYSTEINSDALKYLEDFTKKYNIKNIETIVTKMNDAKLPKDSVDVIFMCSMFHAVYITDIEYVKDDFIFSMKKGLKPGGRIVVVDNNITSGDTPPYYGPGIMPELIISQLHYYGFKLVKREEFLPQRFVLIFEVDETFDESTFKNKNHKFKMPRERQKDQ